jgi:hypothetical protein
MDIEFFDTETINNKTVLICSSENYLWNSGGLNYNECLDFLINNAKKHNYFFRIDYDLNMIIKDLPKKIVLELFENNEVQFKKYHIKYFRHKILEINGKKFYDISNFFHTSLIKTIEILEIDLTDTEKKFVEYMKKQRSKFKIKDKNKIINYSLLENQLGIKIVNKIYSLIPDDLKTYALYGSSSLANKFLKDKIKSSFLFSNELFQKSYFGGRMECLKIGTFSNVYKYDINSAYPNVIKDLFVPVSYEIKKYKRQKINERFIYEIAFNHKKPNEIGCFPVRLKSGYLVFPKRGKGFYFGCEVIEGQKRGVEIKIKNVCEIKFGEKIFSNNEIETMYKLRLKYKKNNDLRNLIYKILLNSIYGKFAQSVGKAQYQNIYLAGYITAKVRSELLKATYNKDNDIIFFATDGILTKKKLNLPVNNELGGWEEIKIKKAIVIQAGIYKLIDTNNRIYIGERGFRFDFDDAVEQIKKGKIYKVKFKTFVSNLFAYKNYKALLKYRCKFTDIEKQLDIRKQHKRIFKTFDISKENNSLLLNDIHIKLLNKVKEMQDFENVLEVQNDFDFIIL